jgi:hypothetical protein
MTSAAPMARSATSPRRSASAWDFAPSTSAAARSRIDGDLGPALASWVALHARLLTGLLD